VPDQLLWNRLKPWAAAATLFGLALLARLGLDLLLPAQLPYITFLPAVVATSYFCGIQPAISVAMISALAGSIWIPPLGDSEFFPRLAGVLLFLTTSGACIYFMSELQRARAKCSEQETHLEVVNRELRHRLKNLLTVADAICQQTIKSGLPRDELASVLHGRLLAIAAAQDALDSKPNGGVDLSPLVSNVLGPLTPSKRALVVNGPSVTLPTRCATSLALVLHELGTNAIKYGAWSNNGVVALAWSRDRGVFTLEWKERNGPPVRGQQRIGLGTMLITKGIAGAAVDYELTEKGARCRIKIIDPTK
jgi:two-component sensor histidine kinase